MRIVAGEWRGRRLAAPAGASTRPTADRVREAWLSVVAPELAGARVLDLFAGSGALGFEALSRGAAHADFVEIDTRALRTLRENAELLGAGDSARMYRRDALQFIEESVTEPYDVAFADPPYKLGLAERVALAWLARPFSRILGVEHEGRLTMPPGGATRWYGDTGLTMYILPTP